MTHLELIEAVEESLPSPRGIEVNVRYMRGEWGRLVEVAIFDAALSKSFAHPTPRGAFDAWWAAVDDGNVEAVARELGEIPSEVAE